LQLELDLFLKRSLGKKMW